MGKWPSMKLQNHLCIQCASNPICIIVMPMLNLLPSIKPSCPFSAIHVHSVFGLKRNSLLPLLAWVFVWRCLDSPVRHQEDCRISSVAIKALCLLPAFSIALLEYIPRFLFLPSTSLPRDRSDLDRMLLALALQFDHPIQICCIQLLRC